MKPGALAEWRSGWPLVLAATLGVSLGSLQIYSTGVFIEPLGEEYGWGRAEVTSGLLITSVLGVIFSPLFGLLIDKWGARRLAIPGAILSCLSFALLAFTGPQIVTWWVGWCLIGGSALMLQPTVWSAAVSSHFTVGRGLALAVMLCGTGLASASIPPLSYMLIQALGWRGAYIALGTIFAVLVIPPLYFFFFDARHATRDKKPASPDAFPGWTAREGFRTRQFYQLAAAAFLTTMMIVGFVVHLVPMLQEDGIPRSTVVWIAGLTGIFSVIGRLAVGYLFDRYHGPGIGAASVALPVPAALLLIFFPGSLPAALLAVVFLGLAIGGEYDAVIYLSSRFFGVRAFGTLFGVVASALLAGLGLGPLIAGAVFDATGNYDGYLWMALGTSTASALLLGSLGRYPPHAETGAH